MGLAIATLYFKILIANLSAKAICFCKFLLDFNETIFILIRIFYYKRFKYLQTYKVCNAMCWFLETFLWLLLPDGVELRITYRQHVCTFT